jgi:hypothetical protein
MDRSTDWKLACLVDAKTSVSMNLQIDRREREKIVILDLKGWLVLGEEDVALLQRLLFLLDSRHRQIIPNLKEVYSIDESGLDTVAFCATRILEFVNEQKQSRNRKSSSAELAAWAAPPPPLDQYCRFKNALGHANESEYA